MAQYKQWDVQLIDTRTKRAITAAATGVVLSAGTADVATLYSDQQGSSLSQPVSISNGELTFYTAKSVTSVDLSIMDVNGNAIYATGLTNSQHRLDINPDRRVQVFVFPMLFNSGATETDTGFDLPANMLVSDIAVRVLTTDATETVDIGILSSETGGDADGLVAAASVGTAGYVELAPTATSGTNGDWIGATKYGVLLASAVTGTDVTTDHTGAFIRKRYRTDGVAKSISYTPSTSDTFKGLAYLEYIQLV